MNTKTFITKESMKNRPAGEPFVWFTSMGLALGLLMIVCLLGLIFSRGVSVFWPKKVVWITLKNNSSVIAGIITKQQKKMHVLESETNPDARKEWQLFVGNKDIYGYSFKFINYSEIGKTEYPKNLMKIERLEYGDAFGIPVSIMFKDGKIMNVQDLQFNSTLRKLSEESVRRWRQIRKIEKEKIGFINSKMEKLRLKKQASKSNEQNALSIDQQMNYFQKDYEILAAEAKILRQKQNENQFKYTLPTGEEKQISIGSVLYFYYPNQLNVLDRVSIFLRNIWVFLSWEPREANTEGGVFPSIFGTFVMTVMMSLAVTPFGVLAAIYLREYAKQGILVRSVRIAVNNLAGVPSIVFGVFGVGFFVYFVGGTIDRLFFSDALPTPTFGTGGILWASLTLALMTVPVVIVATEEALAAVPRGMREGSLACGASKWQTIQRIILPAAAPGILTGLILAMARGAGEVAPLMITGVVKLAPNLPLDAIFPFIHLERKFMHLGFHIYDLGFQSPDSDAAKPMVFATTLLLIALVVCLNLSAILIRERLRKKYAVGAF